MTSHQIAKPEAAAWEAMLDASSRGLTLEQTSAAITEAVLKTVWENARRLYDGSDIVHARCDDGSCNLCILDGFAMALDRDVWAQIRSSAGYTPVPDPRQSLASRAVSHAAIPNRGSLGRL